MKYLVTGGAGFIGSNIARELVRQNQKVKIIDNLSTGSLDNLAGIKSKINFVKGDIRDVGFLKRHFRGIDYVLHQAALRAVPRSVDDPTAANENNITGTLNVLLAARDCKVKRVVFASSSSVYGDVKGINQENLTPQPESPYALTKLAGEHYCRIFYKLYGLETISLRYFNVYGPYQNPESKYSAVIPIFTKFLLKNKSPVIFGNGKQSRDFTYVGDVVQANLLACQAKQGIGEVFNIAAGGKPVSVNKLFELLAKKLDKEKIKPIYDKPRSGDVFKTEADISKAKNLLGYEPKVFIEQGLKEYVKWYKQKA